MSTSFANLKRSRKSSLDKLLSESSKVSGGEQNGRDDRFWTPEVDKAGNGYAVIRFLPAPQGEDIPWVRIFTHGFQGPGGWFINNSLTTLGKKDPVSEHNTSLWNRGDDAGKDLARKQKRRLTYISNIYVVTDPAHPENENKVFLYKYGKRIYDKLNDLMNPEFEDEDPRNPFDLWEGSNFKVKIRNVQGYRNYDKSEFETPSELVKDDDDKMEELWKSEYSLQEFLDPKHFKSYDELKVQLNRVLGLDGSDPKPSTTADSEDNPFEAAPVVDTPKQSTTDKSSDDDDNLSFFQNLADEDD